MVVRSAQPGDLEAVIALDAGDSGTQKASYWKQRFSWYASGHKDRFFLVADQGGERVGFIVGEVRAWEFGSPPSGWIFAIGVEPDDRLHGLGTLLFDTICARFRKAGVQVVRTMIAKDASVIMSFFRSQGMMAGPFIELEKRLEP
ncbi:MAG TPA: GNAT family N-acetyltransferase [Anaeromyxobacteraceae bacterium]|nr:GNAT family N-acetyltransferase [Anaeromyxobacteraceae bacterium]